MLSKKSFLIDRRIFSGRRRSRAATLGTISFHTKTTTDRAIGPTEPCSSENIEDSTFARFSEFFDFRLFRLHRSKPLTGGNPAARPRLPNAQLTATDLNPPMVEVARTKFQSSEKVDLRSADAMALPFPDGAFDAVVCQFGVMFFPDKAKSYQEVNRVLTPGGRYLFNVWDSYRYNPFGRIAHEVAGSFFPANLLSSTTYRSPIIRSTQ